jgi:hypothetical protein
MALDSLEPRIEECEIRDLDDARGGASTKTPYGERLLQSDRIRLFTIEHDTGALRLRISPHKFQDDLEYNAISYVWGATEALTKVPCNGTDLVISPTVLDILHHLDRSRPCWVDSICINQQDTEEKAVQVPLMHQIYSQAAQVVIWMGIPTMQSEKFMAEFPSLLEKERKWNSMITQHLQPWINAKGLLVTDENLLQGMLHILKNQWFERLWTFQECVLAKHPIMLHGHLWINFDEFLIFAEDGWYQRDSYLIHSLQNAGLLAPSPRLWAACRSLKLFREHFEPYGAVQYNRIPYLLHTLRRRSAKEPVDRAWAVTGLFSEALRSKLDPFVDYSDNGRLDFWRTHILFAKTIMVEEQTLGLLTIPPTTEERPHSVPSWCPALEGTFKCSMLTIGAWNEQISGQNHAPLLEDIVEEADRARSVSALDPLSSQYRSRKVIAFEKDDAFLKTCGYVVDTISEVVEDPQAQTGFNYMMSVDASTRLISNPIHAANVDVYARSLLLARRTAHCTNDSIESIPPEYLMTLLCDTRLSREATTAYEDAWAVLTDREHNNFEGLFAERRLRAITFYNRLLNLPGHSFFSTASGRFGITTAGCKPGDKICVFYGEDPLHILRWPESQSENNKIHGEGPAEFCGVAFIPHLMKPHEQEAARLGPDEIFIIG